MKGRALFLLALAGTVFAMSANLHAVTVESPGAPALLATLCVAALWLACAAACGGSAVLSRLALAFMLCMAVAGLLGLIPALRESRAADLAWMLAVAPFYGFGALSAGATEAVLLGSAVCVFLGLFHESERRRQALKLDADLIALEREAIEPSLDPQLADAIESKAKRLLGLRDPAARLRGQGMF